jgi:hypothetical protein
MFRRKETSNASHQPPSSPKKVIIRPPGSLDETLASSPPPTGGAKTIPRDIDSPSKKGSKNNSPTRNTRAVIKPPSLKLDQDEDTAQTQQEYALGKNGIIRPMISPLKPKQDFFSRFSLRKGASLPVIPPPVVPTTAHTNSEQDDNQSETGSISSSAITHALESETEEEVIARIAERRGWGATLPSTNPHILHALLKEPNPFKKTRNPQGASANELSQAVESTLYANSKSLSAASKARFQSGDVVVCGVPRSGQTPVLRVLDALKHKSLRPTSAIINGATWVEGLFKATDVSGGRRIYKTHLALQNILRGDIGKSMVQHKIIVILRDPSDTRLSWYRHVRLLAKKCARAKIDEKNSAEQFANVSIPCSFLPRNANVDLHGKEPEYFINAALRAHQEFPESVLVLFYEELFTDPTKFVEKMAKFTDFMDEEVLPKRDAESSGDIDKPTSRQIEAKRKEHQELIYAIASGLITDALHPNSGKRNGSSGQGSVCFPSNSLERMDEIWDQIVQPILISKGSNRMISYEHLFQTQTNHRYPFSSSKQVGSGGLFRMSNLTVGSQNSDKKKDSTLERQGSTRLKKKDSTESASTTASNLVPARKFGGSFLSLLGPSKHPTRDQVSSKTSEDGPEKPTVTTLPRQVHAVDPDDSDDEAAGRGISHTVDE